MRGKKGRKRQLVVDCHNHICWYGHGAKQLVENMDRYGIDVTWLLSCETPPREMPRSDSRALWPGRVHMPLSDVLEGLAQYPDRFVPFYAPDPREPDALERLQGAVQHCGVRGFGELKAQIMLDNPFALRLFHYCGEAGLPIIFHMDVPLPRRDLSRDPGYWYCCDWENLARALELCPKARFLGHGPGFWREISADADSCPDAYPTGPVVPGGRLWQYMEKYENLYCDLSAHSALNALRRDPELGRRFLLTYQDRCLFGRDKFDDSMMKFLRGARLGAAAERKIMGGNALRLVPLG